MGTDTTAMDDAATGDAAHRLAKAHRLIDKGRWDQAAACLEAAQNRFPDNADVLRTLAKAYLTTNRYQATAGISYVPLRWMNIRLGYEFNKYSSSEGSLSDYTENRGLLTVTLQPDQPWRF